MWWTIDILPKPKELERMKKFVLLCLILCMIIQFLGVMPAGATSDVNLYTQDSAGSTMELEIGDCIGVQFNASSDFGFVSMDVKKVYRPAINIAGVRLSLYAWNTSYEQTISENPIATKEYTEIQGMTVYSLNSDGSFASGEYLFVYESTAGEWSVPMYEGHPSNTRFYKNGYESNVGFGVTVGAANADGFLKELSEDNKIGKSLNPDPSSWVATDGLGRTLSAYGEIPETQEEKYVGIFYWDTSGYWGAQTAPKNIQQLLDSVSKEVAEAAKNDYHHELWGGSGAVSWFWDEPLFGYYTTNDDYVLRKHAELLADAGVDVIFFDFTHTEPSRHGFMNVFEVFQQARAEGVNTPDLAFVLPMGDAGACAERLRYLYKNLYSKELYKDLWFYYEDKPLILAYNDNLEWSGDDYWIRNFFTFRRADAYSWRTEDFISSPALPFWGWLNTYPQTKYYNDTFGDKVEQITVGVAQNVDVVAHKPTAMNGTNVAGRSYVADNYSYSYMKNGKKIKVTPDMEDSVLYGLNFQQQWDYAIAADPTFIFVTGWNEWTVGRYETFEGIGNGFPDQYNAEYSRDIEPSAGILKDHYYYQLVANIRRFKGVNKQKTIQGNKTIDIHGDLSQWDSVTSFDHYVGSTRNRNENGYLGYEYENSTLRNDNMSYNVSYDKYNLYFYVENVSDLTAESDASWMRLFLDTEFEGKTSNWEGFEYVINRVNPADGTCVIERSYGVDDVGDWLWKEVGKASYTVSGKVLQIAVPRKMVGISDGEMAFNFKWSDNMQVEGDILDFYQNGDVAPGGRFMFHFQTPGYGQNGAFWKNSRFWLIIGAGALVVAAVALVVVAVRKPKVKETALEEAKAQ